MPKSNKHVAALRKTALSFPETEEGTSCNKASFKAGKKAFLFVGEKDDCYNTMLKLTESLSEAQDLAKKHPEVHRASSNGWVSSEFPTNQAPPKVMMERWIEESFRALVPKKIVNLLPVKGGTTPTKRKSAQKAAKKSTARKSAKTTKKAARKQAKK